METETGRGSQEERGGASEEREREERKGRQTAKRKVVGEQIVLYTNAG